MKTLNQDIKSGQFRPVYLLTGSEAFLRASYRRSLVQALLGDDTMNLTRFEGRDVNPQDVCDAAETLPFPLRCSGNLFTPVGVRAAEAALPGLSGLMLGRGMLADPSLITRCKGGLRDRQALLDFHEELAARYLASMHPDGAVLPKFKELWQYLALLLPRQDAWKRLRKCSRWSEFHPIARELLRFGELLPEADFSRLNQREVVLGKIQ